MAKQIKKYRCRVCDYETNSEKAIISHVGDILEKGDVT